MGGYDGCGGGCHHMYGMRCGGRHFLLRWILGIIIIAFVFGAGIKLGEFKERAWGGEYGYRMMDRGYGAPTMGYGMMRWNGGIDSATDQYYRYGMMRTSETNAPTAPAR